MKKLTIIAGLAFMALASQAQPGHQGRANQKGKMEHKGKGREMAAELDLTDAQKAKMKEENDRFRTAMKSVKDDANLTAEMQQAKRKALNEEHKANMQNILTAEQREKAATMRKERMEEMRTKSPDATMQKLNLNEDQKAKLQTARQQMQREMEALKNNSSLSQEERRSQMKQIHERHVSTLRNTLTPEQYTQWQQIQKEHKDRHNRPMRQPAKTRK